jgi:lysyl-tRNA synthetase class 1
MSFGHHNNARLREFLDTFGFEYEFKSSTDCYRTGMLDSALLAVLRHYDELLEVILPTLGKERRATYSPFLPLSPSTGRVLQVPILERNAEAGTVVFEDEDGRRVEVPVTGGHCKLQWKCDWAARWYALQVDYEMSGKDLIESVQLSGRICRILGGTPPNGFTYELFLDEKGEKISKSKGNGLAVEEWLKYAPQESLALFMYQKPKTAKRLYFDAIPRQVDEYLSHLGNFASQPEKERLGNPAWHIHDGHPPAPEEGVNFNILLNLVSACHSDDPAVIWHYISRYSPRANPANSPFLNRMVGYAITYYRDFVLPGKRYRRASTEERIALEDLREVLRALPGNAASEEIQTQVYEVGKRHRCFESLKAWFQAIYEILLGQTFGPRLGSFIALYGLDETIALLDKAIAGEMVEG